MAERAMRRVRFLLVLVAMFAVYAVDLANLKSVPISHSESNTQQHLFKTFLDPAYTVAETLSSVSTRSAQHGPLYFVLLNIWQNFAGRDLFALRLLSILFGILSIACASRLASICGDGDIATIAAILTAFLAYLMFYHQLVRMYSLLVLLVAIVAWAYWKVISDTAATPSWSWALLVVSSAALIYVHYYGIIVLAAIGLYHLLFTTKDKKWIQVAAAMIAAGLVFAPWLPVVLRGWSELRIPSENLSLFESILTIAQVYSNGLAPILVVAAVACLVRFGQLNSSQRYLLFLAFSILCAIVVLNEFTPVLAARRLRYTVILAVPLVCSTAIGLTLLPGRRFAMPALVGAWILACFVYAESDALKTYTNQNYQHSDAIPSYQDFLYEAGSFPSRKSLILSVHPDTMVDNYKVLAYYRWVLSDWAHVAHISYNNSKNIVIQSGLSTYATLDAIQANSNSLLLIHDPRQTDLQSLDVYNNWLTLNFANCRRYIESDRSIIEFYVKMPIPCELITAADRREVLYDNGSRLGNVMLAQSQDALAAYFWWLESFDSIYSFSLQVFNGQGEKVRALDAVIGGDPIDYYSLDLTDFPAGEYLVELIVYDFRTGESQPGNVVGAGGKFERAFQVARIAIED